MKSKEANLLLATKFPRLFQKSDWPPGEIADGWLFIVQRTLERIDEALSDTDAATFKLNEVGESHGRLVISAGFTSHCDDVIENILEDAWSASGDICYRCGAYADYCKSTGTLCRECALIH